MIRVPPEPASSQGSASRVRRSAALSPVRVSFEEYELPQRRPVNVSHFRADVAEALAAFAVDSAYAVKMAKRAVWILKRRALDAERKRRAAMELEERVPV